MAVTLYADVIEGSRIETSPGDVQISRMFLAVSISTATPSAVLPLALATDGLPRWGDAHPDVPQVTVQKYMVRGTGEPFSAYIEVIYRQGGGTYQTWYVIDDTVMVQEMADLNPGWSIIKTHFTVPGLAGDTGKQIPFPGPVPRLTPHRTLTVSGLLRRPPPPEILNAIGSVNSQIWEGLKPGFWMCTRARAEAHLFSKQLVADGGFNARGVGIAATFTSRVYRDWREYLIYRDPTGKLANVDPKEVKRLVDLGYAYSQVEGEKVTTIGQYPLLDFRQTFGFGESGQVSPPIGNSWGSPSRT